MRLYLDDDSADAILVLLLRKEGHVVFVPADLGLSGAKDPVHFRQAIELEAALVTHNYEDYELLHDLLLVGKGHHFGLFLVRKDNDPNKDLKPAGIVRAVRNVLAAGFPLNDECIVLNHWR